MREKKNKNEKNFFYIKILFLYLWLIFYKIYLVILGLMEKFYFIKNQIKKKLNKIILFLPFQR
jgi:hypothetical protein